MTAKNLHIRRIKDDANAGKIQGKFIYFSGQHVRAVLLVKASAIIARVASQLLQVLGHRRVTRSS